jgi:GH15 family glucan-1,4-alpha-glucosidase
MNETKEHNKANACLADYALIGNCRSAALVSKFGSIDWCCLPEFHSPSIFASLLDNERGGFFVIQPALSFQSTQNYLPGTNIVETVFENAEGKVRLLDGFVALEETQKIVTLFPDHEIIRIVEGISGTVKLKWEYAPRIYYGKYSAQLKNFKKLGVQFSYKENTFILQNTLDENELHCDKERAKGEFLLHEGESVIFSLGSSSQCPAIIPEIKITGRERIEQTINYWKNWIGKCKYEGLFQELVFRSALTLKLLAHAPSGAIVAAPTTSLPEEPHGVRNWDYRYCWLRDASFTVRVLTKLGYEEEASAYMDWILHATQLTRPKVQVAYTVFGEAKINEKNCDWLKGYKNARPVRIGNAAHKQLQLDVYGEVLDAVYTYSKLGKDFVNHSKNFIIGLGKIICEQWKQPDAGIWEVRSPKAHHTHSKVMAWVGLDRLIKLCQLYNWQHAPIAAFEETAREIRTEIERFGFNQQLKAYTSEFDGSSADASLLVLPLVDYCKASSPHMISTRKYIFDQLSKNGLIYRYRNIDGFSGSEGAFTICNFWFIENLAKAGEVEDAIYHFNQLTKYANHVGLFSEEIDPHTKELWGNFPQGFSHIGLINAALTINEVCEKTKTVYASR